RRRRDRLRVAPGRDHGPVRRFASTCLVLSRHAAHQERCRRSVGCEGERRHKMSQDELPLPTEEEKDDFRRVMGRLASGVCVITTRWGTMDHAMTATAVASVSLEPRLVMFAVHQDARMRDALESSDKWALNVMGSKGQADAKWLAT